jgi:hypothetical protein
MNGPGDFVKSIVVYTSKMDATDLATELANLGSDGLEILEPSCNECDSVTERACKLDAAMISAMLSILDENRDILTPQLRLYIARVSVSQFRSRC